MARYPFMEYIERSGIMLDTYSIDDVIKTLEEYHQFETAREVRQWKTFFDSCILDEFNETCLSEPIPNFPPYFVEGDFDLDMNGWFHEWELPDGYEPNTHYDDGGL